MPAPRARCPRCGELWGKLLNPLRTLLVATDLSASARHAVFRAGLFAAGCGARLALLHVVDLRLIEGLRRFSGASAERRERRVTDDAATLLTALANELGRRYAIETDIHVVTGTVLSEIVGLADRLSADLLVMGARGAGFIRELLLGATTERILRMTHRPVLIVKQMPHEPYRRILLPVDFSSHSELAIELAGSVGAGADAELYLVHAFEVPFERKLYYAGLDDVEMIELRAAARAEATERMARLLDYAARAGHTARSVIAHGRPTTCILEQEQEQDCDLIVIGRQGAGALSEWLLGSVAKHVIALSNCDLLVVGRQLGAQTPR